MSPPSFAITGLGVKGKDTRKRALCSPEERLRPQSGLFKTTCGQHHTQSRHQLPAPLPFPLRAATFLRQGPNARAAWRGREHRAVMAAHGRRELSEKSGPPPLLLTCLMEKGKYTQELVTREQTAHLEERRMECLVSVCWKRIPEVPRSPTSFLSCPLALALRLQAQRPASLQTHILFRGAQGPSATAWSPCPFPNLSSS